MTRIFRAVVLGTCAACALAVGGIQTAQAQQRPAWAIPLVGGGYPGGTQKSDCDVRTGNGLIDVPPNASFVEGAGNSRCLNYKQG